MLDATVNRTTRSNYVLGENERVSPYLALKSMTDWAAYQYFEDQQKGTLAQGKLADLVILDRNPLTIPSREIKKSRWWRPIKKVSSFIRIQKIKDQKKPSDLARFFYMRSKLSLDIV